MNFPWLHYQHLIEGVLPQKSMFQEGIFWVDVERDLAYLPKQLSQQKEFLLRFLLPYIKPHVSAVFDWSDLMPFLKRYADFVNKAFGFIFNPIKAN